MASQCLYDAAKNGVEVVRKRVGLKWIMQDHKLHVLDQSALYLTHIHIHSNILLADSLRIDIPRRSVSRIGS